MEKVKVIWKKGEQIGSFNVTSFSVEECLRVAKEAIKKDGAAMVDWQVI